MKPTRRHLKPLLGFLTIAIVSGALLSAASARMPAPPPTDDEHPEADMKERLDRGLETAWRPDRTTFSEAGAGEIRITGRAGAAVTYVVVTCAGTGHIDITRLTATGTADRRGITCGEVVDGMTRIRLHAGESVTVTRSDDAVQVLWGTRIPPSTASLPPT